MTDRMTRLLRIAPALATVLGILVATTAALDLRAAAGQARAAERAHTQRIADANRIVQLRAREQTALDHKRPESDILRLVTSALGEAGIRTNPQVAPGGSSAVTSGQAGGSARLMCQTVAVTLTDLSPRDLGAFLAAFEAVPGPWGIADITLSTSARPNTQAPQYTARITLAAIYIADEPT